MLNPDSPLAQLQRSPVRPGAVVWIGLRPGQRQPVEPVQAARITREGGLDGDHYASRVNSNRQVTLIGQQDLAAIASYLGLERVDPSMLRRNIVVSGINLESLKGCRVRLGSALLHITGECAPCSRMEEHFGVGGYNAVRGHGGITAQVIEGGDVRVGDSVTRVDDTA